MSDFSSEYGLRELQIALPELPRELIERPLIEIEEILAVQSLVMGYLRKRARTKLNNRKDKRYGLCMLEQAGGGESTQDTYDGSADTYMTAQISKPERDQWHMTVSMLDVTNIDELAQTSIRQLYRFDWLRNGNRQAWYSEVLRKRTEEGLYMEPFETRPIDSERVLALQNEMLRVSQAVNPIDSSSIMVPRL